MHEVRPPLELPALCLQRLLVIGASGEDLEPQTGICTWAMTVVKVLEVSDQGVERTLLRKLQLLILRHVADLKVGREPLDGLGGQPLQQA